MKQMKPKCDNTRNNLMLQIRKSMTISCFILVFIEKIIAINLIKTILYKLFRKWYENTKWTKTKWTFTSQQCAKYKLQWRQLEK